MPGRQDWNTVRTPIQGLQSCHVRRKTISTIIIATIIPLISRPVIFPIIGVIIFIVAIGASLAINAINLIIISIIIIGIAME